MQYLVQKRKETYKKAYNILLKRSPDNYNFVCHIIAHVLRLDTSYIDEESFPELYSFRTDDWSSAWLTEDKNRKEIDEDYYTRQKNQKLLALAFAIALCDNPL